MQWVRVGPCERAFCRSFGIAVSSIGGDLSPSIVFLSFLGPFSVGFPVALCNILQALAQRHSWQVALQPSS